MNLQAFLRRLEDILEMDQNSLAGSERLAELEAWDSLAHLSFIAFADDELGKTVTAVQLRSAATARELAAIVGIEA